MSDFLYSTCKPFYCRHLLSSCYHPQLGMQSRAASYPPKHPCKEKLLAFQLPPPFRGETETQKCKGIKVEWQAKDRLKAIVSEQSGCQGQVSGRRQELAQWSLALGSAVLLYPCQSVKGLSGVWHGVDERARVANWALGLGGFQKHLRTYLILSMHPTGSLSASFSVQIPLETKLQGACPRALNSSGLIPLRKLEAFASFKPS